MGFDAEVRCVLGVLAKTGGAAFYITYLKQICENPQGDRGLWAETVRANLQGLLEHHHGITSRGRGTSIDGFFPTLPAEEVR